MKGFSDSSNVDDTQWEKAVSDDVQNAVMLAFTTCLLQLLARLLQMFFETSQMLMTQNPKLRSYK